MDYYQNNNYQTYNVNLPGQPQQTQEPAEQVPVSGLARRIHGWSWQAVRFLCSRHSHIPLTAPLQFPIGMGTGAVYVTLSGLKQHSETLTRVETFFFFLNISLFLLNSLTLLLQLIRKWRDILACRRPR